VNGWQTAQQFSLGELALTDERLTGVFRTVTQFIEKGYFQANAAFYDLKETVNFVLENKAVFLLAPGHLLKSYLPLGQENRLGYVNFPELKTNFTYSVVTPVDGLVMPAKAFNKKGAGAFVVFMAEATSQDTALRPAKVPAANLLAPVPDAEARWAVHLVAGASYAFTQFKEEAAPARAEATLNLLANILTSPQRTEEYLVDFGKQK
jgi:multiple sugar transport system substrate-binding protein